VCGGEFRELESIVCKESIWIKKIGESCVNIVIVLFVLYGVRSF